MLMRKSMLIICGLLVSGVASAHNQGVYMKKYADQLPLRISVWEDKNGSVWVTFPRMYPMALNYGLQDNPIIG